MPAHTRRLVRSAASWPICSLTRRSTSSPPAVRSAARSGHGLEADRGAPACSSATNASHSASRSWRTRRRRMARRSRQAARRRPPQRLTGAASRDASCRGAGTVYRGPVARPAADYMMSALARRLSYEDRLTELLASVLKGDAELRAELLHRRGLGGFDAGPPEVQVRTGEGLRTMDMHIPLSVTEGAVAEAWWEHKLGVGVRRRPARSVRAGARTPPRRGRRDSFHGRRRPTTLVAQRRGAATPPRRRRQAVELAPLRRSRRSRPRQVPSGLVPGRPCAGRVGPHPRAGGTGGVSRGLRGGCRDWSVRRPEAVRLQNIDAAHRAAEGLLERVAQELKPGVATDVDGRHAPHEAWVSVASVGWWNELHEGWLWLFIAPYAWFDDEAEQVPSFGVSVHLDSDERPRLNADRRFARAVDTENLRLGSHWESDVALGDSMPLEGIVGIPSLTDQARELAKFARDAILRLVRCPPQGTHRRARPDQSDVLIAPVVLDPRKFASRNRLPPPPTAPTSRACKTTRPATSAAGPPPARFTPDEPGLLRRRLLDVPCPATRSCHCRRQLLSSRGYRSAPGRGP